MDIHEIGREHGAKAFHEDCTLCGRCAEFCPDDDVIQIKFFGIRLFGSSREYYKNRVKREIAGRHAEEAHDRDRQQASAGKWMIS